MPPIKIYGLEISSAVRAVFLTAKALDLPTEYKPVDLFKGEHLTPEFIKMNPQHTIPTIDDNGFCMWDSHAIACYLVGKYNPQSGLYPNDPKERAIVDQRLHFDTGILYNRLRHLVVPVIFKGQKKFDPVTVESFFEAYDFLEVFLSKGPWLAGDNFTLADLCCVASASSMVEFVPASKEKYPNLNNWLDKCRALPYYEEANQKGNNIYKEFVTSHMEE